MRYALAVLLLLLMGCKGTPPVITTPVLIGPKVAAVAAQAHVVDKEVDKVSPVLGSKGAPLKAESSKLTNMADALVPEAETADVSAQSNFEAATIYRDELDARQKQIAAQKRILLGLKIGSLVVLVVLAGIIAIKTSGMLRSAVLLGIGGAAVGIGWSIAADLIAPYIWPLVGLALLAGIGVLGYKLGWWEWAATGIAAAVKETKSVIVAKAAAQKTPAGLNAELEKRDLSIYSSANPPEAVDEVKP